MFNLQRHLHGLSRLIVGLFAVQIFVGAFCLVTPVANASTLSLLPSTASEYSPHCDKHSIAEPDNAGHEMGCSHCDLHDELISSKVSTLNIDLPLIIFVARNIDMATPLSVDLAMRPSTGPPLHSPLLHHTNQRIII